MEERDSLLAARERAGSADAERVQQQLALQAAECAALRERIANLQHAARDRIERAEQALLQARQLRAVLTRP